MSRSLPPMNWFRVFEAAARHFKIHRRGAGIGDHAICGQSANQVAGTTLGDRTFLAPSAGSFVNRCRAKAFADGIAIH